jgi:signal transduction histidine kinase
MFCRIAKARSVKVIVTGGHDRLDLSVSDDGMGFDPARRPAGLGLRGIEERVKELQGVMTIVGAADAGTTLSIHLPVPVSVTEEPLARAAG